MQIVAPRPTLGGLMTPLELPDLEAWYDLSRPASTTSDDIRISAANLAALIADKSGNSAVNCLCLNGVAGNTSYVTTGGASIGTGDFTVVADVKCSPTAANGGLAGFRSSIPDASVPGRSFVIDHQFGTPANLAIVLYGAAGTDFRYYRFVNYFSTNAGKRRVITVTRSGTTVKVYSDGVEITPDAEVTGGTAPSWGDTVTSTYFAAGPSNTSICSTDCIYKARLYDSALSAANVLADYQTGSAGTRRVDIDFTAQAKLTASGFTCGTGQAVTIVATGDLGARIAGERDLYQATAAKQPVLLPFTGTKYGYVPAIAGTFSGQDIDVSGDLEVIVDFTPTALVAIGYPISKKLNASVFVAYFTATNVQWYQSFDGTVEEYTSAVAHGMTAGVRSAFKFTRNATTGQVEIYKASSHNDSWTLLTSQTLATGALFNNADVITIAARNNAGAGLYPGKYHYASVGTTIGGSPTQEFNPALYTGGTTFTASTGEVWTLNGGATIVDRTQLYFDGTNDYMKAPAFALSQPETVYFVGKQVTWGANEWVFDGNAANVMALYEVTSTPRVQQHAGTGGNANDGWAVGTLSVVTGVYNGASSGLRVNRGTASSATNIGAGSPNGFTLADRGDAGGFYSNITVSEILIFSGAHDKATQDRVIQYLGRKWGLAV